MKQVLVCKNCDRVLSKPVTIYDEEAAGFEYEKLEDGYLRIVMSSVGPDDIFPELDDSGALIEPGLAYKPIQPFPIHFDQYGGPLQFMPQYWLNGRDLRKVRFINCNDPNYFTMVDSDLKMNASCRCRKEIGWMSEGRGMFVPSNDQTYWAKGTKTSPSPILRIIRWLRGKTNSGKTINE